MISLHHELRELMSQYAESESETETRDSANKKAFVEFDTSKKPAIRTPA